jgi:LuxR family maltose regulon positive regulatory protein
LLNQASAGPVTLVSAGPGSGKTLAVADWAQSITRRVAWLSVDATDDGVPAFWAALVAALRVSGAAQPGSGLSDLSPAASFGVDDALRVVDALAQPAEPLAIVLDDLHHLRDRAVLRSIEVLFDRLGPTVQVVVSARFDPPLRWRRLAIADRLVEIRAEQLAFDEAEAGRLLTKVGLRLPPAPLGRLVERTRGWAAGLRLAASGLDRTAPEEAVSRLRGSDRPVADYLMQEVLDQLSDPDRRFVLRSSVADPVSAELAEVLTGAADAQSRLEGLEAGNGFVVGLAGGRTWFTWHPLFRELLLHRLTVEQPGVLGDLHRQAADWLVDHGDYLAAIRHLTAAADWPAVGRMLTERVAPDVVTAAAPALVEALAPVAARVEVDPSATTLLASAVCNFHRFDYEAMIRDVQAAEAAAGREPNGIAVGVLAASLRMGYSRAVDPAMLTRAARRVLQVAHPTSRPDVPALERYRAIATTNLGTGLLLDGDFPAARSALVEGQKSCRRWGLGLSELTAQGGLALLAALHGQVASARQRAETARSIADQHGWAPEPQAAAHMTALATVALDTGRPGEADQLIVLGTRGTNLALASRIMFAALAVQAAIARDDLPSADRRVATLSTLTGRCATLPPMLAGWVGTARAEHLRARGQVDAARKVLGRIPDVGYPAARRAVTLARCLLAQDDPAHALLVLTTSMPGMSAYRTVAVDAQVVAALAAARLRKDAQALDLLTGAVDLAAETGILGPLLGAGAALRPLLDRYRTLVGGHADVTDALRQAMPLGAAAGPGPADGQELTDRERAVLPYLATHLKAIEIAAELYLSVNTVKSHQQAIYRKLGVSSRREAVDRGRELGLI